MNKVEFKKNFDLGYEVLEFVANHDETSIWIKNHYSVPSSTVSSTIIKIAGTLYEEKRWGLIFSDLIEIETDVNEEVQLELDRFEIDIEDFDEEAFLAHLVSQATIEIQNSEFSTALKEMMVV